MRCKACNRRLYDDELDMEKCNGELEDLCTECLGISGEAALEMEILDELLDRPQEIF